MTCLGGGVRLRKPPPATNSAKCVCFGGPNPNPNPTPTPTPNPTPTPIGVDYEKLLKKNQHVMSVSYSTLLTHYLAQERGEGGLHF